MNFPASRYFDRVPKVSNRRVWEAVPYSVRRHRVARASLHSELPGYQTGQKTIVWIDDYEPGLALYKTMFEMVGYRVLTANRGKAGLELVAKYAVDAVVVDYEMPEMNGFEVASALKKNRPHLPIVLFSGLTSVPSKVIPVIDAFCDKAGSREELLATIQAVLTKNPNSHLQPTSLPPTSEQTQRTVA